MESAWPPSLGQDSFIMHPTRFLYLGLLGLLLACGDSASTGTTTSPLPRDDTPFEYSLLFTPSDPTYGTGGVVSGVGAIWRWSASANGPSPKATATACSTRQPVSQGQGQHWRSTICLNQIRPRVRVSALEESKKWRL